MIFPPRLTKSTTDFSHNLNFPTTGDKSFLLGAGYLHK